MTPMAPDIHCGQFSLEADGYLLAEDGQDIICIPPCIPLLWKCNIVPHCTLENITVNYYYFVRINYGKSWMWVDLQVFALWGLQVQVKVDKMSTCVKTANTCHTAQV